MLCTPKQAAEHWCPETRVMVIAQNGHPIGVSAINRPATDERTSCIGPQCMAWRWADNEIGMGDSRKGFCGKYGEPAVKV